MACAENNQTANDNIQNTRLLVQKSISTVLRSGTIEIVLGHPGRDSGLSILPDSPGFVAYFFQKDLCRNSDCMELSTLILNLYFPLNMTNYSCTYIHNESVKRF